MEPKQTAPTNCERVNEWQSINISRMYWLAANESKIEAYIKNMLDENDQLRADNFVLKHLK